MEAAPIRKTGKQANPNGLKAELGLPDLNQSRWAILENLRSPSRSEGADTLSMSSSSGTALNRGYPSTRLCSPGTGFISKIDTSRQERSTGLAAVRRLACEADAGLLSPEPLAGIRGVKGVKKLRLARCPTQRIQCFELPLQQAPELLSFERRRSQPTRGRSVPLFPGLRHE